MSAVRSMLAAIGRFIFRAWQYWMRDIQRRKSIGGKAASVGIGLLVICCTCSIPIGLVSPRRAASVAPTRVAQQIAAAQEAPAATNRAEPTVTPANTAKPTSTPEATDTLMPATDTPASATATPAPPSATPAPATATPLPPTPTNAPAPTATTVPPTVTPLPTATPKPTPPPQPTAEPQQIAPPPASVDHTGAAPQGSACPPDYPIKGNINSKGEYIYHTRASRSYNRTIPEKCFATEEDAQNAGFRAARDT